MSEQPASQQQPGSSRKHHGQAQIRVDAPETAIRCSGDWTAFALAPLDRDVSRLELPRSGRWLLDTSRIGRLDTAGALVLEQLREDLTSRGCVVDTSAVPSNHQSLLELVARRQQEVARGPRPPTHALPERVGRATLRTGRSLAEFMGFIGEFTLHAAPVLVRPWRLRGKQIIAEIHKAGVTALPIIGLLSFLMGMVVAYQGGITLEQYGANVFIVELVAITMLREMAPMLTAIVVAGRTGSSYAARIGTMRITDEIDAVRALGLDPYQLLILPKLMALAISFPLLTIFADIMGVGGGMAVAYSMFGVDYIVFIDRMSAELSNSHIWVGLSKTPVFAAIVALVGCFHGLRVSGGAERVGEATTVSVVQGIFLVITTDGLFSIAFNMLEL